MVQNYVITCIKRGKKDKVIYNSGLIYFKSKKEMEKFKEGVYLRDSRMEVIRVDIKKAHKPLRSGRGLWCPYCQRWSTWIKEQGNTNCPICGMGSQDFYVKQYNYQWNQKETTE